MVKLCLKPATMILVAVLVLAVSQTTNTQHVYTPSLNPTPSNDHSASSISNRFNNFDLDLLESFDGSRNYFISPASIKATLAMILEGARGEGARQIAHVLGIPQDPSRVRDKLQSLISNINAKSKTTLLEAANAAFVSDAYELVPEFATNLQAYNADVNRVNFANSEAAAARINEWVKRATGGLITEIVNSANFNSDAVIVLANALHFKGKWKHEFEERSTNLKCFHVSKTDCVQTKMMQTVNTFKYKSINDLDAQAIELPYGDGEYAMLVIVPSERNDVDTLIKDLGHTKFADVVDMLEPTEILVNLPTFKIDYTADLVSELQRLGIKEVFGLNADLSGIIEGGQVKINNIMHKATVEVNEKGTVASAATGVVVIPLMGTSMPRFDADRPFLFFIYHVPSRNIIFEGRFNQPANAYHEIFGQPPQNSKPVRQQVPVRHSDRLQPVRLPVRHQEPVPPRQPVAQHQQAIGLSLDNAPVKSATNSRPFQPLKDGEVVFPQNSMSKGNEQSRSNVQYSNYNY